MRCAILAGMVTVMLAIAGHAMVRADENPIDPEVSVQREKEYTREHSKRLLSQLEFGIPSEKAEAARLLRQCAPTVIPEVVRLLASDDRETSMAAQEAYRNLRWKPDQQLRLLIGDLMDDFETGTGSYPQEWLPVGHLPSSEHFGHSHSGSLESNNGWPRWTVVHKLIDKGKELAVPFLFRMIDDPQWSEVVGCAWSGILKYSGSTDVPKLLRYVDNPMSGNRDPAFFVLGRIDVGLAFERAINGLEHDPTDLTCLNVLGELTTAKVSARTEVRRWQAPLAKNLDQLLAGGGEGVQLARAYLVRNLVLKEAIESEGLQKIISAYQTSNNSWVRKYLELALAKLGSPLVLEQMLNIRAVLSDQERFPSVEERPLEEVIMNYLRAQSDPRAAEAILRYQEE